MKCVAGDVPVGERVWHEVPVSLLKKKWKVASRWRWKKPSTMPVLEARSCLGALKHAARSIASHHSPLGMLGDSLTVGGVVSKIRSPGKELLHVPSR